MDVDTVDLPYGRRRAIATSTWSDLPQNLMDSIMRQIEMECGIKCVLTLRLVSKAWHDAFKNYPAAVACIHPFDDLETISHIMPSVASLQIYEKSGHGVDLNPVSRCTQLTRIDFNNTSMSSASVDLACLPASLTEINMMYFRVDPTCLHDLQCSHLTKLDCRNGDSPALEIWTLLQNLPHLKASPPAHSTSWLLACFCFANLLIFWMPRINK